MGSLICPSNKFGILLQKKKENQAERNQLVTNSDHTFTLKADNEAMAAAAVPDSSHPSYQSTSHQQPPSEKASQMAQFLKSGGQIRSSELPPSYNQVLSKENPLL